MSSTPTASGRPWTLGEVLKWTQERFASEALPTPRLDAEVLLAQALRINRISLYTQYDRPLSGDERDAYRTMVLRRLNREPVAYIVGHQEFWSRDFEVDRSVLIPRPDTETLVEAVLDHAPHDPIRVVEVGTGSGAVAITLALERPEWRLWATDVSPQALAVAKRNAVRHELGPDRLQWLHQSLLPSEPDRFHVVVANLPYIPSSQVDKLEVSLHEPRLALDGGPDGLDPIRQLLRRCRERLEPGGFVFLEAGFDQHAQVKELLEATVGPSETRSDLADHPRVTWARRSGPDGDRAD